MKNNVFRLVTLVFCLVLFVSVGFAEKGKKALPSKVTPVKEKLKEPAKKEQPKPKTQAVTPAQISPKEDQPAVEIKSVKPQQMPVQPAPALEDKGTQIKWQVFSSGGTDGSSSSYQMANTVSQTAVGCGSSASYQLSQGYWQGLAGEAYVCGDCNLDGITNIADVVCKINYLFMGDPLPCPPKVVDHNGDGSVNIADVVAELNYLFGGAPLECPLL